MGGLWLWKGGCRLVLPVRGRFGGVWIYLACEAPVAFILFFLCSIQLTYYYGTHLGFLTFSVILDLVGSQNIHSAVHTYLYPSGV